MVKSKSSILSNLEKNYGDTKSIAKSVDLSSIENNINPHKLYNKVFKKIDKTPKDYPTEKISVGDIVYVNNDINNQYEVIETTEKDIKPVMENIDMAKKKLNETQYSVSINGLETTDANALSQMMSAAALADSGSADVGGMDLTSTPELPTPENTLETLPQDKTISLDNDANAYANPEMDTAVVSTDSIKDADFDTVEGEDSIEDIDDTLPSEIENPLNNPSMEDDFEDDSFDSFDMDNDGEFDMDTPVSNDIDFDEEITPTEDEIEVDSEIEEPADDMEITEAYNGTYQTIKNDYLNGIESRDNAISALIDMGEAEDTFEAEAIVDSWSKDDQDYEEITESQLNESRPDKEDFDNIDENVLQELYEIICDQKGDDYLSDYDEVDHMELVDCVKDFGNDIEGFDESLAEEYADALQEKWKNEYTEDGSNDYTNYDKPNWEDNDLEEDVLLPKETEDETYNANKALKDDEKDEESERISESMDALIKEILENADAKSAQETYAEEITEQDDSKCCPKCGKEKCICKSEKIDEEDLDSDIVECLKAAGVKITESTKKVAPKKVVEENTTNKPTIVTDESSFANKPNKALKGEEKEIPQMKTVDTTTFGADASEGFKEPLNCIKCEAVSPKEKIKAIYETAKVRYSKADKSQWNALDRRYITKLIENGCGYTRASKIIFEAKKKK